MRGEDVSASILIIVVGAGFLGLGGGAAGAISRRPGQIVVGDSWAELTGFGAAAVLVGAFLPMAPDGDLLGATAMIGLGLTLLGAGVEPLGE